MNGDVPVGMIDVCENPMLLVRAREHIAIERGAIDRAWLSVTVVVRLLRGAAIAAHRHPPCIEDGPALVHLMTDDRRQHTQRKIPGCADAHVAHDQIEETLHTAPHFRAPFKMCRAWRRVRGTDALD